MKFLGRPLEDYKRKIYSIQKDLYYSLFASVKCDQPIIFILGCQRSGSTMLYNMFSRDFRTKVFGEISPLNSDDKKHKIRLNDLEDVRSKLSKFNHPLIVIKPLVESQNAIQLLEFFPNSKVIWLLRDFKDVAKSNIKKWGPANGMNNLNHVLSMDQRNWRAENVSKETLEIVQHFVNLDIDSYSAAALFWWVRNGFYHLLNLESHNRVLLVRYESLVLSTSTEVDKIYSFIGLSIPDIAIGKGVHSNSVGAGSQLSLNNEIDVLCNKLYDRMNDE